MSVTLTATDGGTGVATIARTVDGSTTTTSGSSSSFTVNGDSTGHAVSYDATDVAGNVAASQSLTLKVDATAPTAASGLAASTGSSSGTIDLSWTAGTDATSGVAGYTVRYVNSKTCPTASTANYPSTTSVGAVTSTTVTQLSSAKLYCFYLVTLDSAGNQSDASNVASATAKLPPEQ